MSTLGAADELGHGLPNKLGGFSGHMIHHELNPLCFSIKPSFWVVDDGDCLRVEEGVKLGKGGFVDTSIR
jgi:hypothetical protein